MRAGLVAALALPSLLLAGCGGDGSSQSSTATTVPPVVNLPVPTATVGSYSVNRCLNQTVEAGLTVANLVVPDTLKLDLTRPPAFPNGRRLADNSVDITLAMIFIDLTKHPKTVLDSIPLDPPANDRPFRTEFPYLAPAQGTPPLPPTGGTNYAFRTDDPTAYVRVDRMGMPAVATALIPSASKVAYNDDNPASDLTGKWVNDINEDLTQLTDALADDFLARGLSLCATR